MRITPICNVPVVVGATFDLVGKAVRAAAEKEKSLCVTFVNPYATSLCDEGGYRNNLWRFDLILCDGIGMAYAATKISGQNTDRISFDATSLSPFVFRLCEEKRIPVFLVGGVEGVASGAGAVLSRIHPDLRVLGAASGYGEELEKIKKSIMGCGYCVVIVGMGVGKQEQFILDLIDDGWKGMAFTCGGYFDQVGESGKYYPDWVDNLNLRFVYRIYKEPRRLARRYFIGYMPFVRSLGLNFLRRFISV